MVNKTEVIGLILTKLCLMKNYKWGNFKTENVKLKKKKKL